MSQSPLWPASIDHLRIDSPDPSALSMFYRDVIGMERKELSEGLFLLTGPDRRLLIGQGEKNGHPYSAWRLEDGIQLIALKHYVESQNIKLEACPTPIFEEGAFAVRDPDDRLAVFGLTKAAYSASTTPSSEVRRPARLQHVVVATAALEAMRTFYETGLGFGISDVVYDNEEGAPRGEAKVYFFRSSNEHHSLAIFTGSNARHDHHCYETTSWNDLRDWLDFLGDLDISAWWGPGRHGPGNNLFFMLKDTDGNNIELSAELELVERTAAPGAWPNSRRMYNRWGVAWVRT